MTCDSSDDESESTSAKTPKLAPQAAAAPEPDRYANLVPIEEPAEAIKARYSTKPARRLLKERERFTGGAAEGLVLVSDRECKGDAKWTHEWLVRMDGAAGTVYAGEVFALRFRFPKQYPLEAPEVTSHAPNV